MGYEPIVLLSTPKGTHGLGARAPDPVHGLIAKGKRLVKIILSPLNFGVVQPAFTLRYKLVTTD